MAEAVVLYSMAEAGLVWLVASYDMQFSSAADQFFSTGESAPGRSKGAGVGCGCQDWRRNGATWDVPREGHGTVLRERRCSEEMTSERAVGPITSATF